MDILSHPIPCTFCKKAQPTARKVGWKNHRNGTQEVDRVTNQIIGWAGKSFNQTGKTPESSRTSRITFTDVACCANIFPSGGVDSSVKH
jgi:hypothetical protein